jgi:glutaryl-CoA dehydrogenase (non-decarboxylating)
MQVVLTTQQQMAQAAFRTFAEQEIAPSAERNHREERTPRALIEKLALEGFLGCLLSETYTGHHMDMITFGLLNEELGRVCSSVRSLITVHTMVSQAILRWGTAAQKKRWLPQLATGQIIAAFGLTEPEVGSDAKAVNTYATVCHDGYVLYGKKKWITYGQIADLFLIIARVKNAPTAFLVERTNPGVSVTPICGMLGTRAAMLAELDLHACRIPRENLVGQVGFGFSHVASTALHFGRYSVAWGCTGIIQACLEASIRYVHQRHQFQTLLKDYQLIRQIISEMTIAVKAARLLCLNAGYLHDAGSPDAIMETSIAKYFSSTSAMEAATAAVQIHGANGCSSDYPVLRYLGDAKVMEIIEGSTQIHQLTIADYAYQSHQYLFNEISTVSEER